MQAALDLCRDLSTQLDEIGHHTLEGGVDCLAYSDEETRAMTVISKAAFELGCRVFQDHAGNITAVLEGENPDMKAILGGSHVDAVPQGGQYDGRAGVLLELGILKELHDRGERLPHDSVLQIFRAEESPRFGKALIGSYFATGTALADDFARQALFGKKQNLKEAMRGQGMDIDALVDKVQNGVPLLPLSHIGAAIEMHIEQANVIRRNEADLGIVTAIRGNTRIDITYRGEAGHTGGAAQFETAASDALHDVRQEASRGIIAMAYLFEGKCNEIARSGRDIVFSVPEIRTPDSSFTKICDHAAVRLEVRSTDPTVLNEIAQFVNEESVQIAQDRNLYFDREKDKKVVISSPVSRLSEDVIAALERNATSLGLKPVRLPSGAGHDVMNLALAGVPSSMVFIPHNGLSHRPDEDMVLTPGDDPFAIQSPFANALSTIYTAKTGMTMDIKDGAERGTSFCQAMLNHGARELRF